jgi:hypothetical protein
MDSAGAGGGAGGPDAGGFGSAEFGVAGLGTTEHPTAIVTDASNITRQELRSTGKLLKLGWGFLTVTFASSVYNPATLLN